MLKAGAFTLLVIGNIKNRLELEKNGYSLEDQERGMIPTDGSIVKLRTSILYLFGLGCLLLGRGILLFSIF
jgi:hypothetical protein